MQPPAFIVGEFLKAQVDPSRSITHLAFAHRSDQKVQTSEKTREGPVAGAAGPAKVNSRATMRLERRKVLLDIFSLLAAEQPEPPWLAAPAAER